MIFLLMFLSLIVSANAKVISMSPALTEIVYALGAKDQLSGVSTYCHYPEEVKGLTRVGTPFSPHYELIVKLNPTLILTQDTHDQKFSSMIKKLGLPFKSYKLESLSDIKVAIKKMATDLKSNDLLQVLTTFEKSEQELKTKNVTGTFYAAIDYKGTIPNLLGFSIASKMTYLSDIVELTGLRNIAPFDTGYKDISLETFLLHPSDFLFIFTRDKAFKADDLQKVFKNKLGLKKIPQILVFNSDYALIPGPRVSLLMSEVARGL